MHDFIRTHFHRATHCDFCTKKVWHYKSIIYLQFVIVRVCKRRLIKLHCFVKICDIQKINIYICGNVRYYIISVWSKLKKIGLFIFYRNFILFYLILFYLEIIRIIFCADLVKRCDTVSRLRHGVSQKVRGALSGVGYLQRGESSNHGDRGRRNRTKRRGYL